jgi:hypothetical protein
LLGEIRGNDDEPSGADFDDGFRFESIECETADGTFDLAGLSVALALDDWAREDDVFEIEDREVGIVEPFGGMKRPHRLANKGAKLGNGQLRRS